MISSIPENADIILADKLLDHKTPAIIRDLPQGQYRITVSLPEFKPWTKIVPVTESMATTIKRVILVPRAWNIDSLSGGVFENIISYSNFSWFILKKGELLKDLSISRSMAEFIEGQDFQDKYKITSLLPDGSSLENAKIKNIYTVDKSPLLLIEAELKGMDKFFQIDLSDSSGQLADMIGLFVTRPDFIAWEPHSKDMLYTFREGTIDAIDIKKGTIQPNILKGIRSFSIYNKHIYAVTDDNHLFKYAARGKDPCPLPQNQKITSFLFKEKDLFSFFRKQPDWRIQVLAEDIIIFINKDGKFLSNQWPYRLVSKDVAGFDYNEAAKKLLVWKDNDIGVVDFSTIAENSSFDRRPQVSWLKQPAKKIRHAQWINKGENILYTDNDTVWMTESQSFGQIRRDKVVDIKKGSSIQYSDKSGRLFYLGPPEGTLYSVEIIPQQALFSLPETEKKEEALPPAPAEKPGKGNDEL